MIDPSDVSRQRNILIGVGLIQSILVIYMLGPWQSDGAFMTVGPVGRDFVNFWMGGHFALTGQLDMLADVKAYNEWIQQTFHHTPDDWFVFSYPPHTLFLLVPFGAIHHTPALWVWTILNILLIERATRLISKDWRPALFACLSPAVVIMVAYGHFLGLLAFAAIYILLHGRERPLLAGLLLALMTLKPQIAASFGVFLLFTGYWRVVLVSVPATLALLGLSVLAFGLKPWLDYLQILLPLHNKIMADFHYGNLLVMVSVYGAGRLLGLSGVAAMAVQGVFSLVVMAKAVRLFRRRGPDPVAMAIGLFAVVVALPYYNCYDVALFVPALAVVLFAPDARERMPFLPVVPALLLWVAPLYAPSILLQGLPVVALIQAGVLLYVVFRHDARAGVAAGPGKLPAAPVAERLSSSQPALKA